MYMQYIYIYVRDVPADSGVRSAATWKWFTASECLLSCCITCVKWFRVQGAGSRVQGSGFRVQGSGFRVQG
jgi:hypothetical protein